MSTIVTGPPDGLTIPEQRQIAVPVDNVEFRDDGERLIFQGHAAVFDRLSGDLGGFQERIQRGAFRKVLDAEQDIRFLGLNHNPDTVLARTTNSTLELREDPKGLRVYAELAPTTFAKDLRILVKRGDISQMSFGFRVDKDVWSEEDNTLVRTIVSFSQLFDVSPVTFPAYTQTDASMRALVCGVEIVQAGQVRETELRDLAWKIHRGEVQATMEERAAIDAVFAQMDTETVSPWMAQRAAGALCREPELQGAIPGKRLTISMQDEEGPSGQPAFRLAARQRRLRTLAD